MHHKVSVLSKLRAGEEEVHHDDESVVDDAEFIAEVIHGYRAWPTCWSTIMLPSTHLGIQRIGFQAILEPTKPIGRDKE